MSDNHKNAVSPYAVISELLQTILNLSALAKNSAHEKEDLTTAEKIKKWLTILECCETCLELTALSVSKFRNHNGNGFKWTIVSLVQLAKCAGRMVLLLKYKEGLLPHPPLQIKDSATSHADSLLGQSSKTGSYVLRSGRRVRSVREDYVQTNCETEELINNDTIKELNNLEIIAESAYLVKPIAHLGTLYFTGRKSWKPWLLALAIDIASLSVLINSVISKKDMNVKQKQEIFRRRITLLLYLLRSPFYDRNTRRVLEIALYSLEIFVPCTSRFIVQPILSNLPLLHQIYFYFWSN